jgi:hypothetical protein
MKLALYRVLAFAGVLLLALPTTGMAEVRRIKIDVTGYLCGL